MFFKEYKEWFLSQPNDKFFNKNKFLFFEKVNLSIFGFSFSKIYKRFFLKKNERNNNCIK